MGFPSSRRGEFGCHRTLFQTAENRACTEKKRKILNATCLERNRRKIMVLSASDPWKYSVRAKKNHATDLEKKKAFQK